jgi:hypothetical protein
VGNHLEAKKGAWSGPSEAPDWSLYPHFGILPEKLRPPDYKGEETRKRIPLGGGFLQLHFVRLF